MIKMTAAHVEKLHEDVIAKHQMWPFWVFADPLHEKNAKYFWCFIGANYPAGLVSDVADEYNLAIDDLKLGHWAAMERKAAPGKRIGYGFAETPSLAFIKACKMAGYMKDVL